MPDEIKTITQEEFVHHPLLKRLLNLSQVPDKIFIQGALPNFTEDEYGRLTPRVLTVVGSRQNSTYGKDALDKLISSLKNEPVIIVSGLALGIDGLAHKCALNNNLITISVPGSGLSPKVLYPKTHYQLSREILAKGGLLLSELEPAETAAQWTFPARNRIMSAISDAILVIEAEEKSGTLITARLSLELGKDIGVVPGSIFSPTSIGTNSLIKDGAIPVTNKEDLFDLLHLPKTKEEKADLKLLLTNDEEIILKLLKESMSKDELLMKSELNTSAFLIAVSSLEIKGYIQETFGEVRKMV